MKIIQKECIQTPRLILKPFADQDRPRLAELLSNRIIAQTFMIPAYPTAAQYGELAEKLIRFSSVTDEAHLAYGIYLEKQLIGFVNDCGFHDTEIEIGYVIHPDSQSRGYATEAVHAVIDDLWEMGFQKVLAAFFEGNEASRKVMEKCGMSLTGTFEELEYRGEKHRCPICEIRRPDRDARNPVTQNDF